MDVTGTQEALRMEIRGIVKVASDAVARLWPLHTFVARNPLLNLESLPFHHAVRLASDRSGARGYLSCRIYRDYLDSGRIDPAELDAALGPVARPWHVELGSFRVSHRDVLRAALVHGVCCPDGGDGIIDRREIEALSSRLTGVLEDVRDPDPVTEEVRRDQAALGYDLTLSQWCDRVLGTRIVEQVNSELTKWCAAFLDEGHAVWSMPGREQGFYRAWKALAALEWSACGIRDSGRKVAALPEAPEDCLRDSLSAMAVPRHAWADYLAVQLAALPGWSGFIRWRAERGEYPWQKACPISLVEYLAVRLWYERELVGQACRGRLGIEPTFEGIATYMRDHPRDYVSRKTRVAGRPPRNRSDRADVARHRAARQLLRLAQALDIPAAVMRRADVGALARLVRWLDAFPEEHHGPIWLEALEATYQRELLGKLARRAALTGAATPRTPVRPQSQSIYCIDVRMEPFRRHLEALGDHETFGFAGFFGAAIRYRSWGSERETEQCPAVTKPRNEVREVPRSYSDDVAVRHRIRTRFLHACRTLVHKLKENGVTAFALVESVGWLYGIPLVGRTIWPWAFSRLTSWVRGLLIPRVATSLTVDKLAPAVVADMLAAEQRSAVWRVLRARMDRQSPPITPDAVEAVREAALRGEVPPSPEVISRAQSLGLAPEVLGDIVTELRERYGLDERSISHRKERLGRVGFTLDEQVRTVEAFLRSIGLTSNFARLVLICAHGSTSVNNPYEAALDCGACGGNAGGANARVVAVMANNPAVRERLRARGIAIPSDTHFLAGQLDTTTDRIELLDLEDVPATHRGDVARLKADLCEAARLTSRERWARLGDVPPAARPERAWSLVRERSVDWSQVRPEWGLAGNAAFIIGPRDLTKGVDLSGRVFLHSYDWRLDPDGRWLELILTGPQLVCEWISMEYYFSTVDNDRYGSGSKVYHNIVGRLGVMSGPSSDLRVGLPRQTVMNAARPFHEPMRLLTVVVAPRERLDALIGRHELLQRYYRNEWVRLVVMEDDRFYRYREREGWISVPLPWPMSPEPAGALEGREGARWIA